MSDRRGFASAFMQLRLASGLTMTALAESMRHRGQPVDVSVVSRVESGKRMLSVDQIDAACAAMIEASERVEVLTATPPQASDPVPSSFPHEDLVALGRRVRQLRKNAGLTQTEVADRMRSFGEAADPALLSQVENGRVAVNFAKLVALAGALRVSLEAIFNGEPDRTDDEAELLLAFRTAGVAGVALWLAQHLDPGGLHRKSS